jgi:hypothetical protein
MNLLNLTPAEFCAATQACREGREFATQHATMADVWDNCPRPDWLLWVAEELGQHIDDRTLRLFAVWCARHTPFGDGRVMGDLLTDPRSLAALKVAERYAHGQATAEELAAARTAARVASWDAARDTALAAPEAAAWAASKVASWEAARVAAEDASWVAAEAAWWDAARKAAWAAARRAQADQFRRVVPNPFRAKESQL